VRHIPRKRFGQHFLSDTGIIEAIVRVIDPRPEDAVVEIGPGLGALTLPLLQRAGTLTVIEIDRDLAARWRARSLPGLTVVESDVLTVDFARLARPAGHGTDRRWRVVGNLPYNISTPILFHLLTYAGHVADQHVMLQKEVVERMVAAPGSKAYGRLSVMLQWRYAMQSELDVPPEAFDPPPAVDSAVVSMVPLPNPPLADPSILGDIVTAAFSQRRKLMRHTLGRWLQDHGLDAGDAGFDLQRRAEEVPVDQYTRLAAWVEADVKRPATPG
jgi:16S rRNA (adenine1518-N6/adenine1519-N6)-dimethyltransferase